MFDFEISELDEGWQAIVSAKLKSASPVSFTSSLTYLEKVKLLLFLINTTHDLVAFRSFLTERVQERTQLTKEKNEIYVQIKEYEMDK